MMTRSIKVLVKAKIYDRIEKNVLVVHHLSQLAYFQSPLRKNMIL